MPWMELREGTLWDHQLDADASTADPYPRVFLTGDGHRKPPFGWVRRQTALRAYLQEQLVEGQVCVHVEELQNDTSSESVDMDLLPAFFAGRVFGWELPIYRQLKPVMEQCLSTIERPDQAIQLADSMLSVSTSLAAMRDTAGLADLTPKILLYRAHYEALAKQSSPPSQFTSEAEAFPSEYFTAAMKMRTAVNPEIGQAIQAKIDQHPDCIHLITCGHTHIEENPLQNFIQVPPGAFGVVDKFKG